MRVKFKPSRCDVSGRPHRLAKGDVELEDQIADATAKVEGDVSVLKQLASTMVDFDPLFEVLPGTKVRQAVVAKANAYEAAPGQPIAE